MSQPTVAPGAVDSPHLLALARSFGSDPTFSACRTLEHLVDAAIIRAFDQDDPAAELDIHRFLNSPLTAGLQGTSSERGQAST